MPDINDNDIDALLRRVDPHCEFCGFIDAVDCARYHRALTALVAERNKLVEDNASQTYKGNSVRYWHDKASAYKATIGSLWEILESASARSPVDQTIAEALTALVAERDALRKRVAFLEEQLKFRNEKYEELRLRLIEKSSAHPPAASDLRERLVCAALQGAARDAHMHHEASSMGTRAVYIVDAAIAAMRKGDANA